MASDSPDFKVTMLLADSAQVQGGKLFVLGGGWTIMWGSHPSALVGIISVPWNESNKRHVVVLRLVTDDGVPVTVPDNTGHHVPFEITTEFEVGRPPGHTPGTALPVPIAFNMGPLPYGKGRYEWRCTINGRGDSAWNIEFEVREPTPMAPQQ
jgi:hypothetical protein